MRRRDDDQQEGIPIVLFLGWDREKGREEKEEEDEEDLSADAMRSSSRSDG